MPIAGNESNYPDLIDRPVVVLGLEMPTASWEIPFHNHRKAQPYSPTAG